MIQSVILTRCSLIEGKYSRWFLERIIVFHSEIDGGGHRCGEYDSFHRFWRWKKWGKMRNYLKTCVFIIEAIDVEDIITINQLDYFCSSKVATLARSSWRNIMRLIEQAGLLSVRHIISAPWMNSAGWKLVLFVELVLTWLR